MRPTRPPHRHACVLLTRTPSTPSTPARPHLPAPAATPPTTDAPDAEKWARASLLRRRLAVATADEDYEEAARVRDALNLAARDLTLGGKLVLSALDAASSSAPPPDRAAAVLAAAPHAGSWAWGALATLLHDDAGEVAAAAERALSAAFRSPPSPAAAAAMDDGDALLRSAGAPGLGGPKARAALGRAIAAYGAAIKADPAWAEAWNARATARYLGGDYGDSLEDCKTVLSLNPHHWGAASGAGMVYLALAQRATATGGAPPPPPLADGERRGAQFQSRLAGAPAPAPPRILTRVQQLRLLSKVEQAGLLSTLEKSGVTLSALEKSGALSLAEGLGLLSRAADRGTPGLLYTAAAALFALGPASVYAIPDDSGALIALQAVVAGVAVAGGSAAFGAASLLSALQK